MNKIDDYVESLLDLPTWIGVPIFYLSLVIPMMLVVVITYLLVAISPWFLLAPVVIWLVCALSWWIKNKDK